MTTAVCTEQATAASWLVYQTARPVARLLLCHGAGAPVQSEFLTVLAQELAAHGIEVWARNFAYMQKSLQGKKQPPPKIAVLQQELTGWLSQLPTDLPLLLAGKSMGGRLATLLLAQQLQPKIAVTAVVVYGYPFRPPAKKNLALSAAELTSRVEHLPHLTVPTLLLQGQRDAFGGPDLITPAEQANWPALQLHWLAGGDHDLQSLKKHQLNQVQLIQQAAQLTREFIDAKILAS